MKSSELANIVRANYVRQATTISAIRARVIGEIRWLWVQRGVKTTFTREMECPRARIRQCLVVLAIIRDELARAEIQLEDT